MVNENIGCMPVAERGRVYGNSWHEADIASTAAIAVNRDIRNLAQNGSFVRTTVVRADRSERQLPAHRQLLRPPTAAHP